MLRIVVAGGSQPLVDALRMVLESVDGWAVEHAAGLHRHPVRAPLRGADLLVLELRPFPEGLIVLRRLSLGGRPPIVALVTGATAAHVCEALVAGATGCLATEAAGDHLLELVRDTVARPAQGGRQAAPGP